MHECKYNLILLGSRANYPMISNNSPLLRHVNFPGAPAASGRSHCAWNHGIGRHSLRNLQAQNHQADIHCLQQRTKTMTITMKPH